MKRICLTLAALSFIFSGIAQKSTDDKVAAKFIYLPPYDVSTVDPSTITADFAAGDVKTGDKKLKDMTSTCSKKGAADLKSSIVKVTTYYYEISMTTAESYVVARDAAGGVLFSRKLSSPESSSFTFGKDKCEYWQAEKMKKDFAAKEASIMSKGANDFVNENYNEAKTLAKQNLTISEIYEELRVYSAKGKGIDYKDLDAAQEKAVAAYEDMASKGPSNDNFGKLKECITVWEKELEGLDSENKEARINKKIGRSLYENLFNACLYTYQVEEAKKHGRKALDLWGGFSNNQTERLKASIASMDERKAGIRANEGLVADLSKLNAKASEFKKVSIKVNKLSSAEMPNLRSEHTANDVANYRNELDEANADYDASVASGETNKYQKYVTKSATQGDMLFMTPLTGAPELTELDKDMCALTDLEQINITNNKIATIAPEIKNLSNLTKLSLNGNKLTTLPAEIGELKNLKTISLNNNPISSIPEAIKGCTSLKTLSLKGSSLSSGDQAKLAEWLPDTKIKF